MFVCVCEFRRAPRPFYLVKWQNAQKIIKHFEMLLKCMLLQGCVCVSLGTCVCVCVLLIKLCVFVLRCEKIRFILIVCNYIYFKD